MRALVRTDKLWREPTTRHITNSSLACKARDGEGGTVWDLGDVPVLMLCGIVERRAGHLPLNQAGMAAMTDYGDTFCVPCLISFINADLRRST